jgi:hypothetical protein
MGTEIEDKGCTDSGAGAPDIEITPEMIAAGEDVLLGVLGGAVSSHWFPDVLAKQVFAAMAACSPKAICRPRKRSRRAK